MNIAAKRARHSVQWQFNFLFKMCFKIWQKKGHLQIAFCTQNGLLRGKGQYQNFLHQRLTERFGGIGGGGGGGGSDENEVKFDQSWEIWKKPFKVEEDEDTGGTGGRASQCSEFRWKRRIPASRWVPAASRWMAARWWWLWPFRSNWVDARFGEIISAGGSRKDEEFADQILSFDFNSDNEASRWTIASVHIGGSVGVSSFFPWPDECSDSKISFVMFHCGGLVAHYALCRGRDFNLLWYHSSDHSDHCDPVALGWVKTTDFTW